MSPRVALQSELFLLLPGIYKSFFLHDNILPYLITLPGYILKHFSSHAHSKDLPVVPGKSVYKGGETTSLRGCLYIAHTGLSTQ